MPEHAPLLVTRRNGAQRADNAAPPARRTPRTKRCPSSRSGERETLRSVMNPFFYLFAIVLTLQMVGCREPPPELASVGELPTVVPTSGDETSSSSSSSPSGVESSTTSDAGAQRPPPLTQPLGWDEDIRLPEAEDLDPDPNVLEVNIQAREEEIELLPGVKTRMWTYNGLVPGPLLRAKRGDRLIVHFTNQLPEPTTIHWHGVEVPASMDGTSAMQDPVKSGETFTYDYIIPDSGTFWYHPHINSSSQVGYGLYGPLIVNEPEEPIAADELVLVLSDVSLDEMGQLNPGDHLDWFGDYFGREGNLQLLNGKVLPRLRAQAGVPQRWRVINASRSRLFKMSIPGVPLVRIGGDGGLSERPLPIDSLILAASERAELWVVAPPETQGEIEVLSEDGDRFGLGFPEPPKPLILLDVIDEGPVATVELPSQLRTLTALDTTMAKARRIEFGEVEVDGVGHLAINGHVFAAEDGSDAGTSHEHEHGATHVAYVGDTEIWEVVNTTDYQHPFHLHGFSFQVLEQSGVPWPVLEWKDTVNVLPQSSVKLVVDFDDRPGLWMFHCHILDHAKLGMMAVLSVQHP